MAVVSVTTNRDGSRTEHYSNGGSVTVYNSGKGQNSSGTGSGASNSGYSGGGSYGGGSSYGGSSYKPSATSNNVNSGYRPPTTSNTAKPNTSKGSTGASTSKPATGVGTVTWANAGTGGTGKQYNVSSNNNSIQVTRPDGSVSIVTPGMSNYNATYNAMQSDLQGAGVNYTPNYTTYRSDGTSYQTKNYTAGNADLQYALQQAAKTNGKGSADLNDYANSLLSSVGNKKYDDVEREMDRLGLTDWLPGQGIYTTGGKVMPGNEFSRIGEDTTGDSGQWLTYGNRQYRLSGYGDPLSDYADYVNGKTGNLPGVYNLFQDMSKNSYAQGDQEFLQGYNQYLQQYQADAGLSGNMGGGTGATSATGSMGSSLAEALNNGSFSGGNMGGGAGGDLLQAITDLLNQSLSNTQGYLAGQEQRAKDMAAEQAHQAWVTGQVNEVQTRNRMAASGLGTSGALDSALLGVQNNYNSAVADVNSNLNDLLNNLTAQGVQALTDYYNNLTNYTYNVTTDQMNRALQDLHYQLQLQEFQYQQDWNQQQMEFNQQKYADSLWQYEQGTQLDRSQNAIDNAYKLLSLGIANEDVARTLGISLAEAQAYANSLKKNGNLSRSGYGSGGTVSDDRGNDSLDDSRYVSASTALGNSPFLLPNTVNARLTGDTSNDAAYKDLLMKIAGMK